MSRTPLARIAFVKLSPKGGKSYAMRCAREDLNAGDHVEVLMYAGQSRAYYDEGIIASVSFQRWRCSCEVVNHISEVRYQMHESGELERIVSHRPSSEVSVDEWRARKKPYFESLSNESRSSMQEIYDAIAPDPGEDVYLGDGIWLRSDGGMEDRGR